MTLHETLFNDAKRIFGQNSNLGAIVQNPNPEMTMNDLKEWKEVLQNEINRRKEAHQKFLNESDKWFLNLVDAFKSGKLKEEAIILHKKYSEEEYTKFFKFK